MPHLALPGGQTGGLCEGPRQDAPSLGSWVRDPPRQALGTPPARPAPSAAGPALPLSMVKAPGVIRLSLPPAEPHSYSNHSAAGPRTATLSGPSETQPSPPPDFHFQTPSSSPPSFCTLNSAGEGVPGKTASPLGRRASHKLRGWLGGGGEGGGREGGRVWDTDRLTELREEAGRGVSERPRGIETEEQSLRERQRDVGAGAGQKHWQPKQEK